MGLAAIPSPLPPPPPPLAPLIPHRGHGDGVVGVAHILPVLSCQGVQRCTSETYFLYLRIPFPREPYTKGEKNHSQNTEKHKRQSVNSELLPFENNGIIEKGDVLCGPPRSPEINVNYS